MRAPSFEAGQGVRRRCQACGKELTIIHTGRTRQFCSDRCRKEIARQRNFKPIPYPSEGLSGTPEKTLAKSVTCKGTLASPRSPFKPVWRVVAGPPVSLANLIIPYRGLAPKSLDPDERRELIKRAIELEFAARWPRSGLR
jgi:hypothetical protein